MLWIDYNINQVGGNFKVEGEWQGEVMGVNRDGTPKQNYLYKPGDVFIVNENGWLCKVDKLSQMIMAREAKKNEV
jgi:hypothetical protein